ncbi:MAG: lipid asymmetry maintenance protein MlaB [Burkholderiaceae bacterium]
MKLEVESIGNGNAAALLGQGIDAIRAGDANFDLSAVRQVDSSAVALLLAWQREAQSRGTRLALSGLPPAVASLAKLYGVDELIPGLRQGSESAPSR